MVTCTQCGTQYEGRFCPSCGAAAPAQGFVPPPPPLQPVVQGIPNNFASVLAYLVFIIGPVVCLMVAPYSKDRKVRFDAFQALFLQVAFIAAHIVIGVFPGFMWRVSNMLRSVVDLAYFLLMLYMIVKVAQSQKVVLPYVGPLAEKQAQGA